MDVIETEGRAATRRRHPQLAPVLAASLEQTAADRQGGGEAMLAEAVLFDALSARATDVHLDPRRDGLGMRLRVDGVVLDVLDLEAETGQRLVNQFKAMAGLDPVSSVRPGEGRFTVDLDGQELSVRVTQAPCLSGDKLAIRLLTPPATEQNVAQLGLRGPGLEALERWVESAGGMLLVTGPTGSGKTTTLYSLLHQLRALQVHVVTLEDPVEYEISGVNQMPVRHERGFGFADGVRAMLRLDPDYLLIGELREADSAEAAVGAAASGRAVMATLHSRDAAGVVTMMRNFGLDDYEIATNLELVIGQRLVRRLCEACLEERRPAEAELRWLQRLGLPVPERAWAPRGCPECAGLGFRGRTGVFEVWRPVEEDYSAILAHTDEHALRHQLAARGHRFLLDDALTKASEGLTSLGELRGLGAVGARGLRAQARPSGEPQ